MQDYRNLERGFLSIEPPGLTAEQGPWTGISAYRGAKDAAVPLPCELGKTGTVMCWLRLDAPILNGPGVETGGETVLEFPNFAKLNLWWYRGYAAIVWEARNGLPSLSVEVPGLPGPQWLHLCYAWDADAGRMAGYFNGTPVRLEDVRIEPWTVAAPAREIRIRTARWAIAGLAVTARAAARDEVLACVPSIYRGALDHTLGAQELGRLNPEDWRGQTLLDIPLNDPAQIAGWRLEGPGDVSFRDGWMRMRSLEPEGEGKEGHIVHWCDRNLPADFLLEFDVRILGSRGLNIIFFCAKGRHGEDVFDPALQPRTGLFGHYTSGDINCYHISYYAHTPNAAGRATSNLRKNHGFYLVDNGPIGIAPGSRDTHRVTLLKRGGTIRLGVDGRLAMDWHDDGVHYGPVLGEGKFALRQMRWTVAEYRRLRVSKVRQAEHGPS